MSEAEQHIAALLSEERVFEPSESFRVQAVVQDAAIYEQAQADPEAFWSEQAERLAWFRHWDTVMNWTPPFVRWWRAARSATVVRWKTPSIASATSPQKPWSPHRESAKHV